MAIYRLYIKKSINYEADIEVEEDEGIPLPTLLADAVSELDIWDEEDLDFELELLDYERID